jgi:hypothetical protein
MYEKVLGPYNSVSVGELSNTLHPSQVIPYVSAAAKELDMVFEFSMIRVCKGSSTHIRRNVFLTIWSSIFSIIIGVPPFISIATPTF